MILKLFIFAIFYSWIVILINSMMRRSTLTSSLIKKHEEDERHRNDDHHYWYKISLEHIDEDVRPKFVQLGEDVETKRFLENCYEKSDAFLWQLWHSVAVPFLKLFMTQTNVNGYLGRGSMFVFSSAQFHELMSIDKNRKMDSLLDLGAGDGKVTEIMASNFNHVYTTEVSTQMQRHLQLKGYTVLDIHEWTKQKYDVISCLNLLDRCDQPVTLLKNIHDSLNENGRLIVASVSPYNAYVEENASIGFKATEVFDIESKSIEDQVNLMVKNVFTPSGFNLIKFSRVPYLCEGDLNTSFYVLYDIIFILQPVIEK